MKKYILPSTATIFLVALCGSLISFAQENSVLTLIGQLPTKGASLVSLHLKGETEIQYWDKDYVQVEVNVLSGNLNRAQLKSLVRMGFYAVKALGNANKLFLTMSVLPVTVNHVLPNNKISVSLTFPQFMMVEDKPDLEGLLAIESASL